MTLSKGNLANENEWNCILDLSFEKSDERSFILYYACKPEFYSVKTTLLEDDTWVKVQWQTFLMSNKIDFPKKKFHYTLECERAFKSEEYAFSNKNYSIKVSSKRSGVVEFMIPVESFLLNKNFFMMRLKLILSRKYIDKK